MGIVPDNNQIKLSTMKHLSLTASALAVLGLTACEKSLDVGEDVISPDVGQVKNSLLQVRTRSGGSGDEATVSFPVTVYVFHGEGCRAAQTIGGRRVGKPTKGLYIRDGRKVVLP